MNTICLSEALCMSACILLGMFSLDIETCMYLELSECIQCIKKIARDSIKKCKKTKWLSEEALQISEKRREAKSKEEKERYTPLNAEFQRLARRDKKGFLSDQWSENRGKR